MIGWLAVAAVVWLFLVAGVIFLAVCRISAVTEDGLLDTKDPLHLHLRHLIQFSDRVVSRPRLRPFICSVILAFMLVRILFPH